MKKDKVKKGGKKEKAQRPLRGFRMAERFERQIERYKEKYPLTDGKQNAREWFKFVYAMRGILEAMDGDVREAGGAIPISKGAKEGKSPDEE